MASARAANFFKPAVKRARLQANHDPHTIIFWNVNGLDKRLEQNTASIRAFVKEHAPDLIFLSETWLKAACEQGQWKHGKVQQGVKPMSKDAAIATRVKSAVEDEGAFPGYKAKYSCNSAKRAGTAMLCRQSGDGDVIQPLKLWYHLPASHDEVSTPHHPEGRVMLAEFKHFYVLHTYTPNLGGVDSFQRRVAWDTELCSWLEKAAEPSGWLGKPLLYGGDLNCAHYDCDLTHPEFFAKQMKHDGHPDHSGQPGCTPGERQRFDQVLKAGDLVDVYRRLHPRDGPPEDLYGATFSWRGAPGVDDPRAGRYYGKGMRIDHCLASQSLVRRVQSVELLGHGVDCKDPSFMGSDHCPLKVVVGADDPLA